MPILTAVVGTVVQTVVDGKPPLEYFEGLTENIITNGIWANLPGKYLGPLGKTTSVVVNFTKSQIFWCTVFAGV